jgi:hypothetical protein
MIGTKYYASFVSTIQIRKNNNPALATGNGNRAISNEWKLREEGGRGGGEEGGGRGVASVQTSDV